MKVYVPVLLGMGKTIGEAVKRRSGWDAVGSDAEDEEKQGGPGTGLGLELGGRKGEMVGAGLDAGMLLALSVAVSGSNPVLGLALLVSASSSSTWTSSRRRRRPS